LLFRAAARGRPGAQPPDRAAPRRATPSADSSLLPLAHRPMTPFGVLADDLTGACDTGVAFSTRGARVLVLAEPESPLPPLAASGEAAWDVLVLNTDSRHLPPQAAGAQVAAARARLAGAGWPVRYKKVDSTLRGPLAAELRPLLAGGALLVVCPAFPAAGRTVQGGVLRVQGTPVHETEIGRDRHNPVPESHLPSLLGRLGVPVAALAPEALDVGPPGPRVIVADASADAHLDALAAALAPAWERAAATPVVAVGSAGLARALAARLLPTPAAAALPPSFPRPGAVLVLAGSRTDVTRRQVQALAAEPGVHARVLEPAALDAPDWPARAQGWVAGHADALAGAVAAGARTLAVSVAPAPAAETPQRFAARSQRLNAALGALVAALAQRMALAGLVLTGGDVARAALRAVEASALQLGPEMLPGIALGWPVGGTQPGLPLVTKAGGFGGPEALLECARFLRHGARGSC
jgi:D-threonate/D-erythronate kinase